MSAQAADIQRFGRDVKVSSCQRTWTHNPFHPRWRNLAPGANMGLTLTTTRIVPLRCCHWVSLKNQFSMSMAVQIVQIVDDRSQERDFQRNLHAKVHAPNCTMPEPFSEHLAQRHLLSVELLVSAPYVSLSAPARSEELVAVLQKLPNSRFVLQMRSPSDEFPSQFVKVLLQA